LFLSQASLIRIAISRLVLPGDDLHRFRLHLTAKAAALLFCQWLGHVAHDSIFSLACDNNWRRFSCSTRRAKSRSVVPPGDDNNNNDDEQEEPPPPPPPVEPTITNINFVEDTFVPLVEPTFVRFDAALLPGPGTFTVTVGCPWDNTSSTFSYNRFENGQFIAAGESCASPGQSHVHTFASQPGITYEYRFDVVDQANSADRGRLRVQWAADPVEPAGPPPAPNEGDGPNNPRPFAIGSALRATESHGEILMQRYRHRNGP